MADNYTFFSAIIKEEDKRHLLWADGHLNIGEMFWEDPSIDDLGGPENHPKWEEYKRWCEIYDVDEDGGSLDFEFQIESDGVWVYSEGFGNVEQAAAFMQLYLRNCRPNGVLTLEAAFTCSKPRPGEFGGSAAFITAEKIEWMSTEGWLSKKMVLHEERLKGKDSGA